MATINIVVFPILWGLFKIAPETANGVQSDAVPEGALS
jgi:hypothetical protein